ncbi:hypothetical protein [Parachitinimonas caeni]|uniref:PilZ domain-containing protein n=1 Tax=Parachitinimonas caeni TaxID=3031301 RepID=A0ABT7E557_9NEIS|nr:hypothetical protein [Parachitinimonas caeni]MDK2126503.1 hypothetical protein [Parachitinimonas caeni]
MSNIDHFMPINVTTDIENKRSPNYDGSMKVTLYLQRQHGRRLSNSQKIALGPGTLTSHHSQLAGGWPVMVVQFEIPIPLGAPGMGQTWKLYDARLQAITPNGLRFIGFERSGQGEDAIGVVQEWLCDFCESD